jgi:hypothetical protein
MTNSTKEYNDSVRESPVVGVIYRYIRDRYETFNSKQFTTYKKAAWYVGYLLRTGSAFPPQQDGQCYLTGPTLLAPSPPTVVGQTDFYCFEVSL